jgi:UDP-N-acetyl-D-glucosamine dehydrogenase
MLKEQLIKLITDKTARVGVLGLGYVGLPLAVEFANKGFRTIGFEIDEQRATKINQRESYIGDISSATLGPLVEKENLRATTDFHFLSECDALIICVPTPLRKTKEPDISYILTAAEKIMTYLRRGQLIVLESTTYPGTTEEVLLPMLEETGLKLDHDFLLAFSPERIDPGNPLYNTSNITKVVGGVSPDSTEVAAKLYGSVVNSIHQVSSARVAESIKLLENTFRAVNIGMANEIARLCYALGIDTWEVINGAATKPFGFMPFYPGPGIGGHCIPLDPHYLSWKARQHGFDSRFISLAEEVNSAMPEHVVQLIADGLNEQGKTINGSQILVLGVTYKKDVGDLRESPSIPIIVNLLAKGATIRYHDSFLETLNLNDWHTDVGSQILHSVPLTLEELHEADCVVILTDHSDVKYHEVSKHSSLIIDTRNALHGLHHRSKARIIRL